MQNNNSIYKNKYIKYKQKYLNLKMHGGSVQQNSDMNSTDEIYRIFKETYINYFTYKIHKTKDDYIYNSFGPIRYDEIYEIGIKYNGRIFLFYNIIYNNQTYILNETNISSFSIDTDLYKILFICDSINYFITNGKFNALFIITNTNQIIYNNKNFGSMKNLIDYLYNTNASRNLQVSKITDYLQDRNISYICQDFKTFSLFTYNVNGTEKIELPSTIIQDEHMNYVSISNINHVIMYNKYINYDEFEKIMNKRITIQFRLYRNDYTSMTTNSYISFYCHYYKSLYSQTVYKSYIFVKIIDIKQIKYGQLRQEIERNHQIFNKLFDLNYDTLKKELEDKYNRTSDYALGKDHVWNYIDRHYKNYFPTIIDDTEIILISFNKINTESLTTVPTIVSTTETPTVPTIVSTTEPLMTVPTIVSTTEPLTTVPTIVSTTETPTVPSTTSPSTIELSSTIPSAISETPLILGSETEELNLLNIDLLVKDIIEKLYLACDVK